MTTFRFTGAGTNCDSKVLLDGEDISNMVQGLRVCAEVGDVTRVELDVVVLEVTDLAIEEPRIILPAGTVALLERLGWTPPAETPESSAEALIRHRRDPA